MRNVMFRIKYKNRKSGYTGTEDVEASTPSAASDAFRQRFRGRYGSYPQILRVKLIRTVNHAIKNRST